MLRPDLALVASLVPDRSRVLDLGCGSGELLAHLAVTRGCRGTGIEIAPDAVLAAMAAGVNVLELDVDHGLDSFATASYDVVVLSRTLQTIHKPAMVLGEMGRIADRCIVSVPNFGLLRHRLRLLRGRMPMSIELPYAWHDTPNIRHTTLVDLEALFESLGLRVEQRIPLSPGGRRLRDDRLANLLAGNAVYVLRPTTLA